MGRKHGKVWYYLIQFFGALILPRVSTQDGEKKRPYCLYCPSVTDIIEHTIFSAKGGTPAEPHWSLEPRGDYASWGGKVDSRGTFSRDGPQGVKNRSWLAWLKRRCPQRANEQWTSLGNVLKRFQAGSWRWGGFLVNVSPTILISTKWA